MADPADPLSPEVVAFVRTHVDSLLQLEALLLVFESGREARSAESLSAQMYAPAGVVSQWLDRFVQTELLERIEGGYRTRDTPAVQELLDAVADAYVRRRISLQRLVFARPSSPAASFAEAFRFRKDKN